MKSIKSIIVHLEAIKDDLDGVLDAKRSQYDNHSERWYESEAAESAEELIDALENASDSVSDAIDSLMEFE